MIGKPVQGFAATEGEMVEGRFTTRLVPFCFAGLLSILATCSKDNGPVNPAAGDVTPPAAVTDLAVVDPTMSSVALEWTAPGDDDTTGTAAQYDVRYSTSPITEASWETASQVSGEPAPKAAGEKERLAVTYLSSHVVYYFALKTADEKPNWSALSNVASDTTRALPDNTPPSAVTDLVASNPTAHSITLSWTAPGDNGSTGTAAQYNLRYSSAPITESNWGSTQGVAGLPNPKPAGSRESFEVTSLGAGITYYFALRTADKKPNWSSISNVADATTGTATYGWSNLGTGMSYEPYAPSVLALTVYGGSLIAGGYFTEAGGVPVNMIAAWDGSSWSDLGPGRGNICGVNSFAIYQGKLVSASVIGTHCEYPLWQWDGASWTLLPGLQYNNIYALGDYDDLLVAGGLITGAPPVPQNSVAAWNGSAWSALGQPMTPRLDPISLVDVFGSYNSLLIAGGDFTDAGGNLCNSIAAWDGFSWSPLSSGVSGGTVPYVAALTVYDDKLIVGGSFTEAGGVACNNVAAWDGNAWSALGAGLGGLPNTRVLALAVYNNRLIVGGVFTTAGGALCPYIAAWDGISWSPLGTGIDGGVSALGVFNGKLIVGGGFYNAGGYPAAGIASWSE
jgi:hypothetical protein